MKTESWDGNMGPSEHGDGLARKCVGVARRSQTCRTRLGHARASARWMKHGPRMSKASSRKADIAGCAKREICRDARVELRRGAYVVVRFLWSMRWVRVNMGGEK